MDAEEFYECFKEALDALGPGFRRKQDVKVSIKNGRFCMSFDVTEIAILLDTKITEDK